MASYNWGRIEERVDNEWQMNKGWNKKREWECIAGNRGEGKKMMPLCIILGECLLPQPSVNESLEWNFREAVTVWNPNRERGWGTLLVLESQTWCTA